MSTIKCSKSFQSEKVIIPPTIVFSQTSVLMNDSHAVLGPALFILPTTPFAPVGLLCIRPEICHFLAPLPIILPLETSEGYDTEHWLWRQVPLLLDSGNHLYIVCSKIHLRTLTNTHTLPFLTLIKCGHFPKRELYPSSS